MHRRNFFRSLALIAGASSVCPNIFIPKFEPVKWKVLPRGFFYQGTLESIVREWEASKYIGTWQWINQIQIHRYPFLAGETKRQIWTPNQITC